MTRWGVVNPQLVKDGNGKVIGKRFGEISNNPSPFVIVKVLISQAGRNEREREKGGGA